MYKIFSVLLVVMLVTGCASKYRVDSMSAPTQKIDTTATFYLALSKDGQYNGANYAASAEAVNRSIERELTIIGATVVGASNVETLNEALSQASINDAEYLFLPRIIHWEDRVTEWSGRPDRITMAYSIYSADTSEKLISATISASSKWATFGGDHPQDLVPKTVQDFLNNVQR